MFKRILVPVDGSETSAKALAAAVKLARQNNGRLRLVNVLESLAVADSFGAYGSYSEEMVRALREGGESALSTGKAVAQAAGIEADTMLYEKFGQRLGEVVAEAAKLWNADLVVVGTHGRRGVRRLFLGSGAEDVIRLAPVPVLVFRSEDAPDVTSGA